MAATYIEEAVLNYLQTVTSVTDYVQQRIYHIDAPQNEETPYITYRSLIPSDDPLFFEYSDSGQPLIQFEIVGVDDRELVIISRNLMNALQFYNTDISQTMDGMQIEWSRVRGPIPIRMPNFDQLYNFVIEWEVEYIKS